MKKHKLIIFCLVFCLCLTVLVACTGAESISTVYQEEVVAEPIDVSTYTNDEIEMTTMMGDVPMYDSVYTLWQVATDVIRGEVLDSRVERGDISLSRADAKYDFIRSLGRELTEEEILYFYPDYLGEGQWDYVRQHHYVVLTIYRIKVLEVFQGNYQVGDIVEIDQVGGAYGNVVVTSSNYVPLEIGNDLVVFFRCWSHIGRPGVLLNSYQSVYFFPASEGRSNTLSLDTELESVVGSNVEISITLNDLLQLSDSEEFTMARNGEWEPTYAPPTERQERLLDTSPTYEDLLELERFIEMMQQTPAPPSTPSPPTPVPTPWVSPLPGATVVPGPPSPSPDN